MERSLPAAINSSLHGQFLDQDRDPADFTTPDPNAFVDDYQIEDFSDNIECT